MNQKRRLLSFLLLSFVGTIVGGSFFFLWQPSLANTNSSSWDGMSTIFEDQDNPPKRQTPAQQDAMLRHAASCERAVIFVHADWSLTSVLGLRFYGNYCVAYLQQQDRPFVDFHYMDYSTLNREPQRLVDLPGWQELKRRPNSALLHGNGELIYLENGRVIAVESVFFNGLKVATSDARIDHAICWTNRLVGAGE